MASDLPLLKEIKSFTVLPHLGLSDHECLKVSIKTEFESQMPDEPITIMKEQRVRYVTKHEFSMKVYSTQGKKKTEEYIQKHNYSKANIEDMYTDLIEIIKTNSLKTNNRSNRASAKKRKKKIDKNKP